MHPFYPVETIPATAITRKSGLSKLLFTLLLFAGNTSATLAQNQITEVITDYNGYWKSGASAVNPVKPDNSHLLLSFSFNNTRYSTGVNDALLSSKGETFVAGDYRALPVQSITGTVNSNTKIGVGALYDGVYNGPSSPAPQNNLPYYLTNGTQGLDLGTCVANLPAGNLWFSVSNVQANAVGDGIPDIIITQIANPTGSRDFYSFADINGNTVGNAVEVVLDNITPVGEWTADFYEASKNPMTLSNTFTQTDRPIRLWAADFSSFGINSSNIGQVAYFAIRLNGNSDVAFVAYNHNTINVEAPLPVTFSSFDAVLQQQGVQLSWETRTELNSDHFDVETSYDGVNFSTLAQVKAAGNSFQLQQYQYKAPVPAGTQYYRIRETDIDGSAQFTKVIKINTGNKAVALQTFPNPAMQALTVTQRSNSTGTTLRMINMHGVVVLQKTLAPGTLQTSLDVHTLPRGVYQLISLQQNEQQTNMVVLQ